MELNFTERIMFVAKRKGMPAYRIAERLGMSRQNFDRRAKINSWTEPELHRLAEAVGCSVNVVLTDSETGDIY